MLLAPESLSVMESPLDVDHPSLESLVREVRDHERPAWELRVLVQALEKRCRAHGAGWTRPWNRNGMAIFRADRLTPIVDAAALHATIETIREFAPEPLLSLPFIDDLAADPALMAFVFYHNRESGGAQYEGLTISLGRPAPGEPARRDRLDLILEDRRIDGRVDGRVDLVRILVCPWSSYGIDRDHQRLELCEFSDAERARFDAEYRRWVGAFHAWEHDAARRWAHWSAEYVEFFSPRTFVPAGTSFA